MNPKPSRYCGHRQRGVVAVLAMMFLVILSSLAAAMAIVSQGNLTTADSHLRINRSLAAAETGMRFLVFRINQITANVRTTDGLIDNTNAPGLWDQTRAALLVSLQSEYHNDAEPFQAGSTLNVGPISLGTGQPTFTATLTPHPIVSENYNSAHYQRPPYSELTPAVSMANPLDATWIRVRVDAADGPPGREIVRTIQLDFRLEKKIKFAMLSKNRIMIGRNVMIEGPVGSRFADTHLPNGHPVQIASDFRGLSSTLDTALDGLVDALEIKIVGSSTIGDMDGDNRINIANPSEAAALTNPALLDANNDGYVDDFDFFLTEFDTNVNSQISASELDTANNIHAAQLLELIDTFGDPNRPGYGDGVIDDKDRYAKLRGHVMIAADLPGWLAGAAHGRYQDFFQGPIHPDHNQVPLTFQAQDTSVQEFGPSDFDVSTFRNMATGSLTAQANAQVPPTPDPADPDEPKMDTSGSHREEVPYGAAHPYDFYERPVYENMTFTNVTIPKGTNALFKNCKFVGVTFVDTTSDNVDPDFNYTGISEADGTLKYPTLSAVVEGNVVTDTKSVSNNIRFDGCTFEGAVVSNAPPSYTHVRNKIAFTGQTKFDVDNSASLSTDQKQLFKRSAILAPHYSVEMGTFVDPSSTNETVNLSGTIVSGVLDIRGQVKIDGTILTTFEPTSGQAPVIGDTSPQFNTTLGYFPSSEGDLEAELPPNGVGVIHLRYNPDIALPDGILGPIDITPVMATYFEGTGY